MPETKNPNSVSKILSTFLGQLFKHPSKITNSNLPLSRKSVPASVYFDAKSPMIDDSIPVYRILIVELFMINRYDLLKAATSIFVLIKIRKVSTLSARSSASSIPKFRGNSYDCTGHRCRIFQKVQKGAITCSQTMSQLWIIWRQVRFRKQYSKIYFENGKIMQLWKYSEKR